MWGYTLLASPVKLELKFLVRCFVCLLAGLDKNRLTDFHEISIKGVLDENGKAGRLIPCHKLYLRPKFVPLELTFRWALAKSDKL